MKKLIVIALCVSINGFTQSDLKNEWQRKLSLYYSNTLTLKLHLMFNQPAYAPGDTAYFRAAFLMAASNSPVAGSQIVTLHVVDNSGAVRLAQEFRMKNGWSGNQLYIPPDFEPGSYRLIAFNDWMLNFDSLFFFETNLVILGPIRSNLQKIENPLRVFPEGGTIVSGLRNRIVVTATRLNIVKVTDASGAVLHEISTDEYGYGSFYLKPEEGESYTVSTGDEQVILRSVDEGIALMLSPATTLQGSHRLVLQSSEKTLRRKDLVIMITQHDKIFYSAVFRFDQKDFIAININPAHLPEGVCYLSVNTTEGETLTSRLLYNPVHDSIRAVLSMPKNEFHTRENITIDLSVTDTNLKPELARISATVYRADLFNDPFGFISLEEQVMLKSNSCCDHGMRLDQALTPAAIDAYLITKKWPWYTWKTVHSPPVKAKYDFRDYQSIYGQLVNKESGKPLKVRAGITFYFAGISETHRVESDDNGGFEAHYLFDYYDREVVFYIIDQNLKKLENAKIELTPVAVSHLKHKVSNAGVVQSEYGAYSKRRHEFIQAFKFFDDQQKSAAKQVHGSNQAMENFLGGVDVEIKIDDYILFPTMKETLTEIIPFLRYGKVKGKEGVYMYRPEIQMQSEAPPMMMIDGVITDNYEYFLSLNPANVYSIKLVQTAEKLNKLGGFGVNGFVLVESKIQNNRKKILAESNHLEVKGLNRALSFREQSSWEKNIDRSPRLKPTLYWKPVELLDENGKASFKFNAADDTGRYKIRVEGLTVDGIPFLVEEEFTVTFKD